MTEQGPRLSVVDPAPPEADASGAHREPPEAGGEAKHSRLVWLLAALLLLASIFLIAQLQHTRDLDRRVQALSLELVRAREEVEAHRQHLRAVQSEVGVLHSAASELERRIAKLDELAGRDPLESP